MFALHWPKGRRLLLEAGSDPWISIEFALNLGDLDALTDLIHKDLRFFCLSNSQYDNLLTIWAQNWKPKLSKSNACNDSLDLFINHLVRLRKRLLDLARERFTFQTQKRLHIDASSCPEDVSDCSMLQIYQTLISNGVDTPSFLYPGCQSSIYHLPYINTFVAERLFRAGFRKIDFKDKNGVRPITVACTKGDLNLALWYLQHGSVPDERLVWILAASLGESFPHPHHPLKNIIAICGYPESDDCQCHCSSRGCLPSMILQKSFRENALWPIDFQWWIQSIPKGSQREAYREACRFELFERLEISHTCCRFTRETSPPNYTKQEFPIDDGCDIREEEQDFAVILDQYLCLFDQLWLEFRGSFKTYWNAWWSAMAMMLPCPVGLPLVCDSIPNFHVDAYWRRHCDTQPGFDFNEDYGPHEKLIRWIIGQYSNVESSLAQFCRHCEPWHVLRSWLSYCIALGIDPPYSTLMYHEMIHLPEDFDMNCFPEDLIAHSSDLFSFEFLFLHPTGRVEEAKRYILEKLVPIMIPVMILEIGFGRSIPQDLRRHFEAEGLLREGVLVRPAFEEDPESIFEDCLGALFDSSSF